MEASCLDPIAGALHGAVFSGGLLSESVGATAASRLDVVGGRSCLKGLAWRLQTEA